MLTDVNGEQLGFLDLLSIASFCIGLENLEQNLTQNDRDEIEHNFNQGLDALLTQIDTHLKLQDKKIDAIMKKLEVSIDDD